MNLTLYKRKNSTPLFLYFKLLRYTEFRSSTYLEWLPMRSNEDQKYLSEYEDSFSEILGGGGDWFKVLQTTKVIS